MLCLLQHLVLWATPTLKAIAQPLQELLCLLQHLVYCISAILCSPSGVLQPMQEILCLTCPLCLCTLQED